MAKWIEWVEPFGPNNEPVYMRVTPRTAVTHMKAAYPTLSDQDALIEFICVYWASIKEI